MAATITAIMLYVMGMCIVGVWEKEQYLSKLSKPQLAQLHFLSLFF